MADEGVGPRRPSHTKMKLPFSPATSAWFAEQFPAPTPAQRLAWPVIAMRKHALVTAPTGSGKTLAAFLAAIDREITESGDGAKAGIRVLYVSPLKALVYDIERNLRAPLSGIAARAQLLGERVRLPRVAVRTGDTSQAERAAQLRAPSQILVTTPESLFLLLGSKAALHLRSVHTLIIDEVHALAPTKRGAHLALSMERLSGICRNEPQRIGLSATVQPLAEAARWLVGGRAVEIVDAAEPPNLDLLVEVPVPDMERSPEPSRHVPAADEASGSPRAMPGHQSEPEPSRRDTERGLWSALYPALLRQIRAQRSTIVFVNSRGLAERLCQRLNELAGEELVRAHHGSVSHEQRAAIEDGLKAGTLPAIVATSSLEMGIDMGALDQVLLVESPGSVARGLQRVGRAGHGVGERSRGRIYPKFRGDLLECAVVAGRMLSGEIEALRVPSNALDVLAQQVVAMVCAGADSPDALFELVRKAGCYAELSRAAFDAVLEMLSGHAAGGELGELRPLLGWDRAADRLTPRKGAPMVVRLNAGTIPDRGLYAVHLGDGPRIGELDEEMVHETKAGEVISLGAGSWRVQRIERDRVIVAPAPGESGRLPFWHGDGPGRPVELGRALGAFTRAAAAQGERMGEWIRARTPLDEFAAGNLAAYLREQREATGKLPSDRTIVIERFRDELGDWRICILSPFGSRIHAPWVMALQWHLGERAGVQLQLMYTDDGMVLRFADGESLPEADALLPDPELVEERVTEQLADTALFASLFRENAARALLMPRRRAEGRRPLWAQRLQAQRLLASVRRYPGFPILLETYRQALADQFDLPGLIGLLGDVRARRIRVHMVDTDGPSPFARSLVFAYVGANIYEQDAPLAERRAQALSLDRRLLSELLGQAALRELLDGDALAELELELQHLTADRRARDADGLHDLLRRLGDLSGDEAAARCDGDAPAWLAELERSRRAIRLTIAGAERWISLGDAGLYRDALGLKLPADLPPSATAPVPEALVILVLRYARTHGPFVTADPARRYALPPGVLEPLLGLLEARGQLSRGEIRPGGIEPEWCETGVLRRLRRASLARLRNQIAAVDGATFARFLGDWHGLAGRAGGQVRLSDALVQLEGLAVPFSVLDRVLLPARVSGYRAEQLDMLAASGELVWIGSGALGARDGRIRIYRRSQVASLIEPAVDEGAGEGPVAEAMLAHLSRRGACFLVELTDAVRSGAGAEGVQSSLEDMEQALWSLVWAGLVTNDTFAPLRSLAGPRRRGARAAGLGGGRWSLVSDLRSAAVDTERLLAGAHMLLERYGVVSRECVQAEQLAGGFSAVYPVLKQMEERGLVRRGHFVEGLSGAQFALPGALERLRGARLDEAPVDGWRESDCTAIAAVDPANPYGALLPWPDTSGDARPKRVADAWVILVAGEPLLWLAPGGSQLVSFVAGDAGKLDLALAALAGLPRTTRRRRLIRRIDGLAAIDSPLAPRLLMLGYERDGTALAALPAGVSRV